MPELLRAYRANPSRAMWEEHRFNLRAMIELSRPSKGEATERVNWKALAKELEAKLAQAHGTLADYKVMAGELRSKCDELTATNGELRGRIGVLEQYAPKRAA